MAGYYNKVSREASSIVKRPNSRVVLNALREPEGVFPRTQRDPTPDLIVLTPGPRASLPDTVAPEGFVIWCEDTKETWYAPNQECLDANFIYRGDLEIISCVDISVARQFVQTHNMSVTPGVLTRKSCYIMDDPASGTYEVYYDSTYPAAHYGKDTPTGHTIWKYPNRFHRDIDILELDALYSETSKQAARDLTRTQLADDEAIVVSDGAWASGTSCYTYVYIDKASVCRVSEGCKPSDPMQAALISEVNGAYEALSRCVLKGKKVVTYYYDNIAIANTSSSTRLGSIPEVKRYQDLCNSFIADGGDLRLVQIHPKTGENRDEINKAIKYFHMLCDRECRVTADICSKDYATNAVSTEPVGVPYKQLAKGKSRKTTKGKRV